MIQKMKTPGPGGGSGGGIETSTSTQIIPQRTCPRKRVTRRAVQAELQFLLAARGARR